MNNIEDPEQESFLTDRNPQVFSVTIQDLNAMFETDTTANLNQLRALGGIDTLFQSLRSDRKTGIEFKNELLTSRRIQNFGDNQIKPPKLNNFFLFMYKQTKDFCIRILALASLLMFLLATISADPFESIVQAMSILIAILAVVIIGAITDYRKEKQFIALYLEQEELDKKYFTIIRDGRRIPQAPHNDILVGDLVEVTPGDSLTFDGILFKGTSYMEVDESMITGVSVTLKKRPVEGEQDLEESKKKSELLLRDCFMRAGSNIFEGCGTVLVCAVGENTYSNRQKNQNSSEEADDHSHDETSPLQKSTTMLAKYLVFIGCMSATFMFVILELYMVRELNDLQERFWTGRTLRKILSDFIDAFLIIVLSIPEGLPLIVTLSLAFSINQLKQKGVIVRNLHVCQVLGGMDTVCFDKTGTLTKNNVTLSYVYADLLVHNANQTEQDPLDANWPLFRVMSEAVLCNNSAQIGNDPNVSQNGSQPSGISEVQVISDDAKWQGNRIDCALMEFLERKLQRAFVQEYLKVIKRNTVKLISLNESKNNYTAAIVREKGDRHRIYIKGKPAEVLKKCDQMVVKQTKDGNFHDLSLFEPGTEYSPQKSLLEPLQPQDREDIANIVNSFTEQSVKTIGLAFKDVSIQDKDPDWDQLIFDADQYNFIGVAGFIDEIRNEAIETIQELQEACIDIKMITGDTRIPAVNVGRHLYMVTQEEAQLEILRKSEILLQSRVEDGGPLRSMRSLGSQMLDAVSPGMRLQKKKKDQSIILQKQLQENINISMKKMPIVLNFQEYLIRVRQILKASEKIYTHTVITEKNCIQLISEILEDRWACEKIIALNREISIVAEANQEQKQNFIRMLVGINDCTIGYVGDGNNDARSLKTSHVGFAPGTTATNVAKESSGVILLDDKLNGIGPCIRWGRNIFLNIKRFIYFQLSFYFASIMIMLVATIAYQQQPYSVLQVIWLALVQDIFSAISLSTERPQKTILAITRPFGHNENLINGYLIKLIVCQFIYQGSVIMVLLFFAPYLFGVEPSQLHAINEIGSEFEPEFAVHFTIVYHVTAMFQIVNLINARRIGPYEYNTIEDVLSNRPFIYMLILLIVVENIIIYEGGKYFKTAPLTLGQNLICVGLALGSLATFWIAKYLFSSSYFGKQKRD